MFHLKVKLLLLHWLKC